MAGSLHTETVFTQPQQEDIRWEITGSYVAENGAVQPHPLLPGQKGRNQGRKAASITGRGFMKNGWAMVPPFSFKYKFQNPGRGEHRILAWSDKMSSIQRGCWPGYVFITRLYGAVVMACVADERGLFLPLSLRILELHLHRGFLQLC